MINDKQKWNERYLSRNMPKQVTLIIQKYIEYANVGQAIDIACGTGRNTHFLADRGFDVDAIDFSDQALKGIKKTPYINKIDTDLDKYNITPKKYDLIVNVNYLNRRLISQMKDALKPGGIIMIDTLMVAHGNFKISTTDMDHLLRKNELLHSFVGLDVIYYEERVDLNLKGEKIKVASLVAKKV
ncbi:MAG: tellurite methyltransferase [Sulfurimonas sp.]|jgi:tellurite methyltransferase